MRLVFVVLLILCSPCHQDTGLKTEKKRRKGELRQKYSRVHLYMFVMELIQT